MPAESKASFCFPRKASASIRVMAQELSALDHLVLLCGRYEGVDERVGQVLADRELSIGDYVLSGGELGAAVIVDAITRLIPGALGNEASTRQESFTADVGRSRRQWSQFHLWLGWAAGLSALHAGRRSFAAWRSRSAGLGRP